MSQNDCQILTKHWQRVYFSNWFHCNSNIALKYNNSFWKYKDQRIITRSPHLIDFLKNRSLDHLYNIFTNWFKKVIETISAIWIFANCYSHFGYQDILQLLESVHGAVKARIQLGFEHIEDKPLNLKPMMANLRI